MDKIKLSLNLFMFAIFVSAMNAFLTINEVINIFDARLSCMLFFATCIGFALFSLITRKRLKPRGVAS